MAHISRRPWGSLRAPAPTATAASVTQRPTRCLAAARTCWYSTDNKGGDKDVQRQPPLKSRSPSFKGQLMLSIQQRLAREKADRVRISREKAEGKGVNHAAYVAFFLLGSTLMFYYGYRFPRRPSPESTLPIEHSGKFRHDTGRANLEAAWSDFVDIVGRANVSTTPDDLKAHGTSDFSSHQSDPAHQPFCVVYPTCTEDVSLIMKVCHTRRIPVTGFSGGTSLEGHLTPTRGGICVDFSRMDKVIALHRDDLDVVVQPGVGWEALNDYLADENLFFPPDPGPGAMIGGMIGTGCSGTNAYRYGTMREWVLSLTVVLADGTIIKTRQRPRKSSAGYDLTKLFIGSEGTLGLVTEATLKLAVRPQATSVAVAAFPSIRAAADCVAKVVREGIPVAAVEILDDDQMRCINEAGSTSRKWKEVPTLFFKFSGTDRGVKEQVDMVRSLASKTGSKEFDFARSPEEQVELWSARKEALWSTIAVGKPGDHVWTGDVAVPISRLPEIIEETKSDFKASGLRSSLVGHVGDGNFHMIILYNDTERKLAEDCVHRMVKRAVEMEGTVTGEHGVGMVKRDYLPHELGIDTIDAMRKIKQALDPKCLLNCDKVIRMTKPKRGEVAEW